MKRAEIEVDMEHIMTLNHGVRFLKLQHSLSWSTTIAH